MTTQALIQGKHHFEKYHARNPIARRMVGGFLDCLTGLVNRTGAQDIHEIGCGEGHLCSVIAGPGRRLRGTDLSEESLAVARQELTAAHIEVALKQGNIYELLPESDAAELVICCEVLEHVEDPERALEILASLTQKYLLISVPREPVWCMLNMLRGKYLGSFGNTPGHLNHWSKRSFIRFAEKYVDGVAVRTPLPWTMLLCKPRTEKSATV